MKAVRTERVPDVTVVDEHGGRRTLRSLLDREATVLFFLRGSSCPACISHARKLVAAQRDGRLTLRVILVTPGDADDAKVVARRVRSGPETTVVASGDAHELIGLPKQLLIQHSGTFVVGPDGVIRYARTALLPTGSYNERDLLKAVAGDAVPAGS